LSAGGGAPAATKPNIGISALKAAQALYQQSAPGKAGRAVFGSWFEFGLSSNI
jgi:hypothetical protein